MKIFKIIIWTSLLSILYCQPKIQVPVVVTNTDDFSILSDKEQTVYRYVNASTLHFIYKEDYHDLDGFLEYKIFDSSRQIVQSNTTQSQVVKYGVNKIKLPLTFTNSGFYTIEVVNEKGVKQFLKFQKA